MVPPNSAWKQHPIVRSLEACLMTVFEGPYLGSNFPIAEYFFRCLVGGCRFLQTVPSNKHTSNTEVDLLCVVSQKFGGKRNHQFTTMTGPSGSSACVWMKEHITVSVLAVTEVLMLLSVLQFSVVLYCH